jgi:tetratricopeptide (TPR) repeat protein
VNLYDWMGRYAEELAVCERALALVAAHPELGGAGRRGRLLQAKGAALGALGRLRDEAQLLQEANALAERTNDVELRGFVALEFTWCEYMRGEIPAALAHADTALRLGQQIGSGAILGPTFTLLGALHCAMGRWNDAIGILELIADRVRLGRLTFEPIVRTFLAEAYLGAGDPLRARITGEGALVAAQQRGTRSFEARAYMALARVLLGTEGAAARQQLEAIFAAIDVLIAETGALSFEAHMRLDRAELARLLGDRESWQRELRAARAQFLAMDAPKMVAKADALLAAGL